MDPRFKTSFIPKQEIRAQNSSPSFGFRFSVLAIVASILFVAAFLLSLYTFFYHRSLINQINKINAQLIAERESFEPELIDELVKLDRRLNIASSLLSKHITVTPFFSLLEKETLQGVRFTNLNYDSGISGNSEVEMGGEAISFLAVALQSDIFGAEPRIKNPVFDGLGFDDKGNAKFNVRASLDESSFLYEKVFSEIKGGGPDIPPPADENPDFDSDTAL